MHAHSPGAHCSVQTTDAADSPVTFSFDPTVWATVTFYLTQFVPLFFGIDIGYNTRIIPRRQVGTGETNKPLIVLKVIGSASFGRGCAIPGFEVFR